MIFLGWVHCTLFHGLAQIHYGQTQTPFFDHFTNPEGRFQLPVCPQYDTLTGLLAGRGCGGVLHHNFPLSPHCGAIALHAGLWDGKKGVEGMPLNLPRL